MAASRRWVAVDGCSFTPRTESCVIAVITLPLALSALPKELMESAALSTSGLVAVFLAVWGATDVARSGQKVFAMFISTGKEKGQGLVEYALILVLVAIDYSRTGIGPHRSKPKANFGGLVA